MKTLSKLLFLFVACFFSANAFAACALKDNDAALDNVRNAYYGCICGGGGTVADVGNGGFIFKQAPYVSMCIDVPRTDYDKFSGPAKKICSGYNEGNFDSAKMEWEADLTNMCWRFKCKNGAYFKADTKTNYIDTSKCVSCEASANITKIETDPTQLIFKLTSK